MLFLDKGLMYGAYEAWDGSGIHLSESGVNGFPIKRIVSNGVAVQLQWKGFTEMQNTHILQVLPVKRDAIWFNFQTTNYLHF